MIKKLEDMNLLDNFLFGSMVTYPEIDEKFTRTLLKIIFGREFKHLSVYPQKVYYGSDSNLHGTRLDVYLKEKTEDGELGEQAAVYDIEPDKNDNLESIKALPYRLRFYHAKIDARSLKSGVDYENLKNVIIIMIMPYDPFGLGRMVYTIKNNCVEEPNMDYEDGARTLFLYTGGTKDTPGEALVQLMHYMEDTTLQNAVNEDLLYIHTMVKTVKQDAEVTIKHMRLMEDECFILRRGKIYNLISLVCKKIEKQKTVLEAAEELEQDVSAIEPIYEAASAFAPDYDCEQIYEQLVKMRKLPYLK